MVLCTPNSATYLVQVSHRCTLEANICVPYICVIAALAAVMQGQNVCKGTCIPNPREDAR